MVLDKADRNTVVLGGWCLVVLAGGWAVLLAGAAALPADNASRAASLAAGVVGRWLVDAHVGALVLL